MLSFSRTKTHHLHVPDMLPRGDEQWLETGYFNPVEKLDIITEKRSYEIETVTTNAEKTNPLLIISKGIPRTKKQRKELFLINKFSGLLAVKMMPLFRSIIYNQPCTGGSAGFWCLDTINTRKNILIELIKHYHQGRSDNVLVGTSLGAYIIAAALPDLKKIDLLPKKIILISPPAFPEEIEEVPYGKEFTAILKKFSKFDQSPIFERIEWFLKNKDSKIIITFSEYDHPTIPFMVQNQFFEKFFDHKQASMIVFRGVGHSFKEPHNFLEKNEKTIITAVNFFSEFIAK